MTQIQMFQPGKAFYDAFQQSRGNTLAKMAFQSQGDQRKSALADLYGIDANAANTLEKGFNEQDKADFADFSRTILAMPDDLKPQIYAKGVQRFGHKFRQMGVEPPEDYTQALPLFQQAAGGGSGQPKARSAHILDDGTLAYMDEYGKVVRTGEKASNNYRFQTDAQGNVFTQDPRQGTLAPTPMAGNADPMKPMLDNIAYTTQAMKSMGLPPEQINAWSEKAFAEAQSQVSGGVVQQGGQARVGIKPDASQAAPSGYRYNQSGSLEPIPGGPADPAVAGSNKAPTQDQSNAAGFYSRMKQSEQIIAQIEAEGYSPAANKGDYFSAGGTFTNWATSPKGQKYYNAASNWIRANLRKESGAAIGVDEAKQEYATYFPIPGDTKETIEQKRQLRQQTVDAVKGAGMPAMKYQDNQNSRTPAGKVHDPLGILK